MLKMSEKTSGNLFWRYPDPCAELDKIDIGYMGYNASIFLHGVCGFFALALNEAFGYDIVVTAEENIDGTPWDERVIHIYCCEGGAFIDIRGITEDEDSFLDEFSDFMSRHDEFFEVSPETLQDVLCNAMRKEEYDAFYQAAKKLVEQYRDEYQVH